jgi:hypothetical protein
LSKPCRLSAAEISAKKPIQIVEMRPLLRFVDNAATADVGSGSQKG